jgi:NMD protein affecting ribosome stability and mRNA decay
VIKENNEDFERRWRESHSTVEMVALMLLRNNLMVQILPQELRPTYEQRMEYSDKGDLVINDGGMLHVCEVKGIGYDFKDGKHPFKQAFICNRWSFDQADPKPSYYFIVEKNRSTCAVFDVERYGDKMEIVTVTDKKRPVDETYEAYAVDSQYFSYRSLRA